MISVLLPTRERIQLLKDSMKSLGHGDFEVLLRRDLDDPEIDLTVFDVAPKNNIKGERVGYDNFHLMINQLAEQASGDWLMLWNDDALMFTPKWWEEIEKHDPTKPMVLNFFDPTNPSNNLFPVVSRAMYEAMGHFSLSTHCDSWVQDIANELGIHVPVYGIEAKHIRDQIWDGTKTHSQGAYATTSPLYDSPDMAEQRKADANKIKELL